MKGTALARARELRDNGLCLSLKKWVLNKLNVRRAVLAFWMLTLVYVGALLWIDHDKGLLSGVARLQAVLPVLLLLSAVVLFARFPYLGLHAAAWLHQRRWLRLARLLEVLAHGFEQLTLWRQPKDLLVCALCGFVAWGLTSYAFVLLLDHLGLSVPTVLAFSIFPLAMLVGAASMIPGGIGSTEAVVILLLSALEFSVADGAIAAIGIRLASLWFATLLGLLCMLALEYAPALAADNARPSS